MLSHSHQKKIQVKKTTFYFDYSENGIEFYKSEIDEARKKAFKNLDDFTDISNGIRKYHLAKAQQFLPNIFSNKFSQQKIKNLLKDDFEETNQNYKKIEA